jgi:hypothetical protein
MDCLELIMEKLAGNPVQVQSTVTQTVLHQTICLSQNYNTISQFSINAKLILLSQWSVFSETVR